MSPAEIAARLSPAMVRCLRDYARHGYGDGSAWATTYRALMARGLMAQHVEPGWYEAERRSRGRVWGLVVRRRWLTELGQAVAAELGEE